MGHIFEHLASRMPVAGGRAIAFVLALPVVIIRCVTGPLFG